MEQKTIHISPALSFNLFMFMPSSTTGQCNSGIGCVSGKQDNNDRDSAIRPAEWFSINDAKYYEASKKRQMMWDVKHRPL